MAANATYLLADAVARAASRERDAVQAAMLASTFSGHGMPFGPTRFVNGQNEGAAAAFTQIQDGAVRLIAPQAFSDADLQIGPPPPPPEAIEVPATEASADGPLLDAPEETGSAGEAPSDALLPELPPAIEVPSSN